MPNSLRRNSLASWSLRLIVPSGNSSSSAISFRACCRDKIGQQLRVYIQGCSADDTPLQQHLISILLHEGESQHSYWHATLMSRPRRDVRLANGMQCCNTAYIGCRRFSVTIRWNCSHPASLRCSPRLPAKYPVGFPRHLESSGILRESGAIYAICSVSSTHCINSLRDLSSPVWSLRTKSSIVAISSSISDNRFGFGHRGCVTAKRFRKMQKIVEKAVRSEGRLEERRNWGRKISAKSTECSESFLWVGEIFGVKHGLNHFLKTLFSAENVHNLKKVNIATIVVCAIFPINHKTPEALNLGRFMSGISVSVMSRDTAPHSRF